MLPISASNTTTFEFETISSAHMITHITIGTTSIQIPNEGTIEGTTPFAQYHISFIDIHQTARRLVQVEIWDIQTQNLSITATLSAWEPPPGWQTPGRPTDPGGQIICEPRWP
jgi:hypothetical protein